MLAAPEEAWDIVWDIAMKMAHDPGNPIVNTLGMLCIYGWNQARVKCAQRGEDNGVG